MTTIVTGAAGNLGSAVVEHLCSRGGDVIAVGRQPSPVLDALAAKYPGKVKNAYFDVADSGAWATAMQGLGPIDGAVLTAGSWAGGKAMGAAGDTWRKMMSVNADTVYASLAALVPGMVARGAGSIVVVGARMAMHPETAKMSPEYVASKAAAVALTQATAAQVRDKGVRINAVLPSTIDTPSNRASMPKADPNKWVKPETLAGVIAHFLSEATKDVTGTALEVTAEGQNFAR